MNLLILFYIHHKGWCKPMHAKEDFGFKAKGWCPVLAKAYESLKIKV